jgi:hypothetical protein
MGKGPADTRTPNHKKRRENYTAINWCKHEPKIYWPCDAQHEVRCRKCGKNIK